MARSTVGHPKSILKELEILCLWLREMDEKGYPQEWSSIYLLLQNIIKRHKKCIQNHS